MAPASPEAVLSARRCRSWRARGAAPLLVLSLTLVWLPSCGDPCRRLAEDVCRCAVSRAEEQRCMRHVRNLASQSSAPISSLGRERCAALEQTCTCEALADGNLSACGLTETAR